MTEEKLPNCPKCGCEYVYEVQEKCVCPECSCQFSKNDEKKDNEDSQDVVIKDANGVILADGDTVVVIKDLKIKGSSNSVKVGTKVKNIRLAGGDHDIDCTIPGFGSMGLKSEFVRKA